MSRILPFADFASHQNSLKLGVVVDTNVLIAATYELDDYNSEAIELFDQIAELSIPVFCNVNVRSEFLEIHCRIIFTEALLDFEAQVNKANLPDKLVRELNSLRTVSNRKGNDGKTRRLPETEIKIFHKMMSSVSDGQMQ